MTAEADNMALVSWALLMLLPPPPAAAACPPMDWSLPAEVPPGGWAPRPRRVRFMAARGVSRGASSARGALHLREVHWGRAAASCIGSLEACNARERKRRPHLRVAWWERGGLARKVVGSVWQTGLQPTARGGQASSRLGSSSQGRRQQPLHGAAAAGGGGSCREGDAACGGSRARALGLLGMWAQEPPRRGHRLRRRERQRKRCALHGHQRSGRRYGHPCQPSQP